MITEDRMRVLFAEANPVPDEATFVLDEREVIAYLATLEQRSSEVPQQSSRPYQPSRYRGPAWAVAAFVAVLAVAALYFAFADDPDQVADNPPPPTTVAPDVETMTDLQIIEAGVAALYSGDAERAVELFGIEDSPAFGGGDDEDQLRDDELIRREAAYQAAIGGRLTLNCTEEVNTPGMFTCNVPYHNALTDAMGYVDSPGDLIHVVVQDGVITQFGIPNKVLQGIAHEFPQHNFLLRTVISFLEEEVESSERCGTLGRPLYEVPHAPL